MCLLIHSFDMLPPVQAKLICHTPFFFMFVLYAANSSGKGSSGKSPFFLMLAKPKIQNPKP